MQDFDGSDESDEGNSNSKPPLLVILVKPAR